MEIPFNHHSPHSPHYIGTPPISTYYNSDSAVGLSTHQLHNTNITGTASCYLHMVNDPQSKYRFRYAVEMNGMQHGCLTAESADKNKKEYIKVQLKGYSSSEEVIIRCTLVTNNSKPIPHVHQLCSPDGEVEEKLFHDITISHQNNWTATFSRLIIIRTTKKQVRQVIEKRMMKEHHLNGVVLNRNQERQLKDQATDMANTMDLHSVKLKFECFAKNNELLEEVTFPIYSIPIYNQKNPYNADLKIVRIDKIHSCCSGMEEIFIFIEQINKKDIKIRFFETNENDVITWSAFADFSELDVHHRFAIAFRTPPYRDQNIQSPVLVQFQLYRPSNESVSEPKSFTYTPLKRAVPGVKRQRHKEPAFADTTYLSQPIVPEIILPQFDVPYCEPPAAFSQQPLVQLDQGNEQNFRSDGESSFHFNSVPSPNKAAACFDLNQICLDHGIGEATSFQQPLMQLDQVTKNNPPLYENSDFGGHSVPPLNQELSDFAMTQICFDRETLQLLNDDQWQTDGSHEENSHEKKMEDIQSKMGQLKLPSKFTTDEPFVCTSEMLSKYVINITKALRLYTQTGDASSFFTRMQHLMAIQCEKGNNALHDAVIHNQINVVSILLGACRNVDFINATNNSDQSPLHVAVLYKRREAVALLLQHGADPNITDYYGNSVFHIAARDRFDCLQLLLKPAGQAIKINARNYAGLTPLHIAINAVDVESAELLCSKSDVNCFETKQGRSPLQLAVLANNLPIVNQLLRNPSVDVNMQSYDGVTALHLAVIAERVDICAVLVKHGADPVDHLVYSENEEDDDEEEEEEEEEEEDISAITLTETPKSVEKPQESDSGIDLLTSKELTFELDDKVIGELAHVLDSSSKNWIKLADSFGVLQCMEAVIVKQHSPTSYLLENLELWEISIETLHATLRELNLNKAADIVESFMLNSNSR